MASKSIGNLSIKVSMNASQFRDEVKEVNRLVEDMRRRMMKIGQAIPIDKAAKSLDALLGKTEAKISRVAKTLEAMASKPSAEFRKTLIASTHVVMHYQKMAQLSKQVANNLKAMGSTPHGSLKITGAVGRTNTDAARLPLMFPGTDRKLSFDRGARISAEQRRAQFLEMQRPRGKDSPFNVTGGPQRWGTAGRQESSLGQAQGKAAQAGLSFAKFRGMTGEGFMRGLSGKGLSEHLEKSGAAGVKAANAIGQAFHGAAASIMSSMGRALNFVRVSMLGLTAFGVKQAGFDLMGGALENAGKWEKLSITFRVMTGSIEEGKWALEKIQEVALRTPFTIDSMAQAVQRFMAAGFSAKQALPLVEIMGDLASATTLPLDEAMERLSLAMGQIHAKGRLMGQELRQLSEIGVPALEAVSKRLSAFFGREISPRETLAMVEEGLVDSTLTINAMIDIARTKTKDLMTEQSTSWLGLKNQVKETWQVFTRELGFAVMKSGGLKTFLGEVRDLINSIRGNWEAWTPVIDRIMAVFKAIKDVAVAAFKEFVKYMADIANSWSQGQEGAESWYKATKEILNQAIQGFLSFKDVLLEVFAVVTEAAEAFSDALNNLPGMQTFIKYASIAVERQAKNFNLGGIAGGALGAAGGSFLGIPWLGALFGYNLGGWLGGGDGAVADAVDPSARLSARIRGLKTSQGTRDMVDKITGKDQQGPGGMAGLINGLMGLAGELKDVPENKATGLAGVIEALNNTMHDLVLGPGDDLEIFDFLTPPDLPNVGAGQAFKFKEIIGAPDPDLGAEGISLARDRAKAAMSPFQTFMEKANDTLQMSRNNPDIFTNQMALQSVGEQWMDLKNDYKSLFEPAKMAGFVEEGTTEAYSTVAKWEMQQAARTNDPQKEAVMIQKAIDKKMERLVRAGEAVEKMLVKPKVMGLK